MKRSRKNREKYYRMCYLFRYFVYGRFLELCFIFTICVFVLNVSHAQQDPLRIPILVPITGFLALEGMSQRNGALLALRLSPIGDRVIGEVIDTGTSPEGARTAFQRGLDKGRPVAVVSSMLGTQMLALLPVANLHAVPLITISGTSAITEQNSEYVFRFFPADTVAKYAHARYVVDVLKAQRPALITQTTAYGQSGRKHLLAIFESLGVRVVSDETLETSVRNTLPVLQRVLRHSPDVLLLHLHAQSTALTIRQAKAWGIELPIVAGSAMHQPSTANLLHVTELKGVCAETASSPISRNTPQIQEFVAAYRTHFQQAPDAFALAQFDGLNMVLAAIESGVRTAEGVRAWLAHKTYPGLAMTYRSDGYGNMAHSAQIICYDGTTRTPRTFKHYHVQPVQ